MDWLIYHNVQLDCHRRDSDRLASFKAQKIKLEHAYISTLRGSNQIQGADLVIVVWWAVEGIVIPKIREILVVSEYAVVLP